MVYVYSNKENHLDLNILAKDKQFSIHVYFKIEIERLLPEKKQPMKIFNQILLNATANQYDPSIPLPEYSQIKTYVNSLRKQARGGDNEYSFVAQLMKALEHYEGIDPSVAFSFSNKLGDGSDSSHFIVNFTALKLLEMIPDGTTAKYYTIYHIDATHKVTINRFPIIIFGRSDMNGVFHPIIVSICSHETEADFSHIYSSIVNLCKKLKINITPTYIMQDACRASYNAAVSCFEPTKPVVLMCWFHLMFNMNEKLRQGVIPFDLYKSVIADIYNMHFSMSETEFILKKEEALNR
jgi:hypothetical protein